MARTFGAPLSVPAGKHAANASMAFSSGRNRPSSADTRCITCEYRSTYIRSRTFTDPYSLTRPRSLRPRSTSITCSARSFSSPSIFVSSAASSASSRPRGCVPAIGRYSSFRPPARTSISGDEPSTCIPPEFFPPPNRRKYIYGDGFTVRSARYRSNGATPGSKSQRCESTTWKMSPAAMYSLARRTLPRNFSFEVRGFTLSFDCVAALRQCAGFQPVASFFSMRAMSFTARS